MFVDVCVYVRIDFLVSVKYKVSILSSSLNNDKITNVDDRAMCLCV